MKYTLELTESQLNDMILGVEIFARSLMGQADIVGDILADAVFSYDKDDPDCEKKFDEWLTRRDILQGCLRQGLDAMVGRYPSKNELCENLIDIWHVLRHQQWLNLPEESRKDMWDVRSTEPFAIGTEPLMKMKKMEEEKGEEK